MAIASKLPVPVSISSLLSRNAPVGCSGKANQKPIDSEPAATLSR